MSTPEMVAPKPNLKDLGTARGVTTAADILTDLSGLSVFCEMLVLDDD